jgi:hypothetical protein
MINVNQNSFSKLGVDAVSRGAPPTLPCPLANSTPAVQLPGPNLSVEEWLEVYEGMQDGAEYLLNSKYKNGVRLGGRLLGAAQTDKLLYHTKLISTAINTVKIESDSIKFAQSSTKEEFVERGSHLTKTTTMVLASMGEGAAIGALVGSVIPGPGNVVGCAIGAIVGVGVGLLADQYTEKYYDEKVAPHVNNAISSYYDWIPPINIHLPIFGRKTE